MAANLEPPQATWLLPTATSELPSNQNVNGALVNNVLRAAYPNLDRQFPRRSPHPVPRGMDKRAP